MQFLLAMIIDEENRRGMAEREQVVSGGYYEDAYRQV